MSRTKRHKKKVQKKIRKKGQKAFKVMDKKRQIRAQKWKKVNDEKAIFDGRDTCSGRLEPSEPRHHKTASAAFGTSLRMACRQQRHQKKIWCLGKKPNDSGLKWSKKSKNCLVYAREWFLFSQNHFGRIWRLWCLIPANGGNRGVCVEAVWRLVWCP